MNKRQYKKKKQKFIAKNNYPNEPFDIMQCPYCGFDSGNYIPDEIKEIGGQYTCKDYKNIFNGDYSGYTWTSIITCPIYKTIFEYEDSDI